MCCTFQTVRLASSPLPLSNDRIGLSAHREHRPGSALQPSPSFEDPGKYPHTSCTSSPPPRRDEREGEASLGSQPSPGLSAEDLLGSQMRVLVERPGIA